MTRYILDTCVLSEIRNVTGDQAVKDAVDDIPDDRLFVSVISFGEIRRGASLLPLGRRRSELEEWLTRLEAGLSAQTLSVDLDVAKRWGDLTAAARLRGQQVAASDGLIAATALKHNLVVMTRNVRDFEPAGVTILNPWSPASGI